MEQIIDGSLNSLSSPDTGTVAWGQDSDGNFYVGCNAGEDIRIYSYVYSKDTPTTPDTELTVYSLKDSNFIKQAAVLFQKKYPDIYVNIEAGMSGDDSVTDTDALKVLNTEIMAGTGPDVLLLDGISEDTYIERGMLENLSGVLKDEDILPNIKDAYTKEEKRRLEMNVLKKITNFVSRYMAAIVILMALIALFAPSSVSFIKTSYVNTLLGIVMFGMGLTLKPDDFKVVFSRPKDVIIGCIAQFTIMPLLAFGLTKLFHLSPELAVGVILVGTCPGGTSSNVMTYLSKGDVALSVGMTSVSTILAPFLTPLLTKLYAGQTVDVNVVSMFVSIIKVVIVPILLGFVINHFFKKFTETVVEILPLISTTAIVAIVAAVVSANSAKIMTSGLLIIGVVILHNVLGYTIGYGVGKVLKLDESKCRAISIEVGMQNSGLATSLATVHFAQYPLATIPGAVFSVWHNVSGAILANFFARTAER